MKRGQLTNEIQKLAKAFLKREITVTELRLYPYLDFVMKNDQWIDPRRINGDDRHILVQLRSEGHVDYHSETFDDKPMRMYLALSKNFYDYINQALWLSYVAFEEQPEVKKTVYLKESIIKARKCLSDLWNSIPNLAEEGK